MCKRRVALQSAKMLSHYITDYLYVYTPRMLNRDFFHSFRYYRKVYTSIV